MLDIEFEDKLVNVSALDADLRAALGEFVYGISTTGTKNTLIVHLRDEVTPEQTNTVRSIVQNHDPNTLTKDQQEQKEREARLEEFRETVGKMKIDPADIESLPQPMQLVVRKLMWLEDEVLDMQAVISRKRARN